MCMCTQTWEEKSYTEDPHCSVQALSLVSLTTQYGRIPSCFIIFDRHKHYKQTANHVNFQQALWLASPSYVQLMTSTQISLQSTVPIQHLMSLPRAPELSTLSQHRFSLPSYRWRPQRGAGYFRKDTWHQHQVLCTAKYLLVLSCQGLFFNCGPCFSTACFSVDLQAAFHTWQAFCTDSLRALG